MRNKYSFICTICGASFKSYHKDAKCCSKKCSSKSAYLHKSKKDREITSTKDREITSKVIQCPFNEGVACDASHCWKCGWNPAVAQRRLNEILGKGCT